MRQVHEELPEIIRRIEYGAGHPVAEPSKFWPSMGGMGGGAASKFGRGFM